MRSVLVLSLACLSVAACGTSDGDTSLEVAIVSPAEGAAVTGTTEVEVTASSSHGNFELEFTPLATVVSQDGERFVFSWTPADGGGTYTLIATATSDSGQSASDSVTVTFRDTYAPEIRRCATDGSQCAAPVEGAEYGNTLSFLALLPEPQRDDGLSGSWTLDGAPIDAIAAYPFRTVVNTTTLEDGPHTLALTLTPDFGEPASVSHAFTVKNCDLDDDGFPGANCGGLDCDDTDPDFRPDAEEICDGRSQDCDSEVDEGATCGADQRCVSGACVASACTVQGGPCDASTETPWPFACDLEAGVCRQRCALDHPNPVRACPSSTACVAPSDEALGSGELDDAQGWCEGSSCTYDGDTCEGGVCVLFDFGFGACGEAGAAGEGEACTPVDRASRPLTRACEVGLECFNGTCVTPCEAGAGTCGAGTSCVQLWSDRGDGQDGVCLAACGEFGDAGCGDDATCQPVADYTVTRNAGWVCIPTDAPIAEGEPCERGVDVCAGGLHCVDIAGPTGGDARCRPACDLFDPTFECGDGFRCAPTYGGLRGTCIEECDPLPRADDYGCATATDTCHPASGGGGACVVDGDVPVGDDCGPNRSFGECADRGYCVDLAWAGNQPVCHALCDPFAEESGCGDGEVCNLRPLLDGHAGVGVCDPEPNEGAVGDACTSPGNACADAGTICVDTGDGPRCRTVCAGPEDCGGDSCEWTVPLGGTVRRAQAGVCALGS